MQPEIPVDLGLVCGVGASEDLEQVAEHRGERHDLLLGHPLGSVPGGLAQFGLVDRTTGLRLGDPAGQDGGVASLVEGGAVLGELAVALGDRLTLGLGGPVIVEALTGNRIRGL